MSAEIRELPVPPAEQKEQKEPTLEELMKLVERIDYGLQMCAGLLADFDIRLRKLELIERKRERKLVLLKD